MSFKALAEAAERLGAALREATGRNLIAGVSVEPPNDDQGEAAFIRTVLWGYVLWFEACQPAGRYLMSIVRNSSPEDHRAASRAFQDVQNLRTYQAHNLLPSSRDDQYRLNQAKAWLAQNGGTERDWHRCTTKMSSDLKCAIDSLHKHWNVLVESPEDKAAGIQGLINALEREWEPHWFDRIVDEVAISIGLSNFDAVRYREFRLNDWQRITGFFLDRASASAAVRRAIQQEMETKFGMAAPSICSTVVQ